MAWIFEMNVRLPFVAKMYLLIKVKKLDNPMD